MNHSTGLSFGILDIPIIGGALRLVQDTGINTNLNASPQWRQYGPTIISSLTTIAGVVVIAASGGTLAPFVIPAIGAAGGIATTVAAQQISQYYTTNPAAYISDKYGSQYTYSTALAGTVTVPENSGFSTLMLGTAAAGAAILIIFAVKKRNKRKNNKGDYQI